MTINLLLQGKHLFNVGRANVLKGVLGVMLLLSLFINHANAAVDNDVKLLDIDGNHLIMYWAETTAPYRVKYRVSRDGGIIWSGETHILVTMPLYISVAEFDGIYKIGTSGRLVASFALKAVDSVTLLIIPSDDYGVTWNAPEVILTYPDSDFIGCPTLTTQYNETTNILSVTSTIVSGLSGIFGGQGNIWYASSTDGGASWNNIQGLGSIEKTCVF